ncbi:unnamed protein product [Coffea canephora]|uniref:DH200=94 genomic scaffold, scaffold_7190 n=1 Tax=Coffea canephora TaxID=49390 RepID=A0A068VMC9_COFCA|nr:unnamed protein product [Coffea canephora]
MQSTRTRSLGAVSGYTSSIRRSIDHSVQDSGKEHRADVSSRSLEHPEQKKSNKKRKSEG